MENHIFKVGDIISNGSKTDVRVILKAEKRMYEFLNCKEQHIKMANGERHISEKGSSSNQPADIVERHFYLIEI